MTALSRGRLAPGLDSPRVFHQRQHFCESGFGNLVHFIISAILYRPHGFAGPLIMHVDVESHPGISAVALLGRGGGEMRDMADLAIVVPDATTSDRIQELHIKILHIAIEAVERAVFPENY